VEQKLYVRRSGGQGTHRLESLEGASLKKIGHSNIEWPIPEVSYKRAIITALRVDRDLRACFLDEEHCAVAEAQTGGRSALVEVEATTVVGSNAVPRAYQLCPDASY